MDFEYIFLIAKINLTLSLCGFGIRAMPALLKYLKIILSFY